MPRPRWLPAAPHIHFMAAAPLDGWVRLLLTPGARIPWRYWPRVGVNVALSACVTAITLPERVVLGLVLWWRGRRSGWRLLPHPAALSDGGREGRGATSGREHFDARPSPQPSPRSAEPERGEGAEPPALVILGYYRSGTTHLHNLLACDARSYTPRWGQVLSPQGFVVSWLVLKLFLWAVLPTKRPQDDMAFGPEWPGEDDFALSNWTLSSPLSGRVVLPNCYEHFARYNDLEGLTARERGRWRRTQWGFLYKMRMLARGRRLLLKTPPHTARVPAITDVLGGPGRVQFIYLSRDPDAVLRSNQRLMKSMEPMHLQDGPAEEVIRERLEADYALAERRFAEAEASIRAGDVVRMRYEDLIAEPEGELRRAYGALGLEWTSEFERALRAYLKSVAEYRSETQKLAEGTAHSRGAASMEGGPGRVRERTSVSDGGAGAPSLARVARMVATVATCLALWTVFAWLTGHRGAIFAMLSGIALGHASTARRPGSPAIGIGAGVLTLLGAALGMLIATRLADFRGGDAGSLELLASAWWRRFTHESTLLWTALGALAALRLGSRRFGIVPGV